MKYVSIFSVTLKSAITPSFIGLIATTLPGVRPSMSFASRPTATTSPLILLIATIEGSFTTIPLPCENTNVFAVPKSIARSDENRLNTDLRLYPFLFITAFPLRRGSCPVGTPSTASQTLLLLLSPYSLVHAKPQTVVSPFYLGTTIETCCLAVPPRRFEPITTIVCCPGSKGSVKCRNVPSGSIYASG